METVEHSGVSPVAGRVIEKCGGVKAVAVICDCSVSWVYRWTYPREKSGRGGFVPQRDAEKLLAAARRGEISLSPSDFFENA